MYANAGVELQTERRSLFTRLASAFARRDFEAVAAGVMPTVRLTLTGSSWLAGVYLGYEGFSQYVEAARLVLEPAEKQIRYLHDGLEMVVMHEFFVGSDPAEIPLTIHVLFADDGRISSLSIEPQDPARFDRAVERFLALRRDDGSDRAQTA